MSKIVWRNPLLHVRTPEWVFAMYLLLLHFVWEMLQTPFYVDMATMAHWPATLFCLRATLGDVVIGLAAFGTAALLQRDRGWFLKPSRPALLAYLGVGLLATVLFERHAIATGRWTYASLMPVIPGLGVGVIPVLQWIVLPWPALFLLRRHHLGARTRF